MDFPHLEGATEFPFNPEPAPYETYRNTFDYSVWSAGTSVKLLSVPWDADNVVAFTSDTERDQWFAEEDGYTFTMQTPQRMAGKEIKIPLPYDMGALYNYVWLEFAAAPVEGENTERGVLKWGFFIDSLDYRAPSATALMLSVDWWTTFLSRLTIPSVHLVQGHWPVAHSATPAVFLSDPLAHTENLLDSENDTLSAGRKVNDIHTETWNTGDQLAVIDTGLVNPGGDYSGAMPVLPRLQTINNTPAGRMTAVTPGQLGTFLAGAPAGLVASIRALYIVPRRLLSLGSQQTLYGATCWQVLATTSLNHDIKLQTTDFAYPTSAAGWTKLYTGQYARLQLQTESGQTVYIPIEQVGASAALHAQAAAGDGLRIMGYLAGIGTEATGSITLKRLDTSATPVPKGSWQETLMEWAIPSYQVLISAADLATWQKTYERENKRSNALAAYRNSVASADTAKTNTDNSADTAYTNGVQSAQTAYRNSVMNADASLTSVKNQNSVNYAYRYQDREQNWRLLDNSMGQQIATLGLVISGDRQTHNDYITDQGSYSKSLTGSTLWKTAADGNAAFAEYKSMQDLAIATSKDRLRTNAIVSAANTAISSNFGGAASGFTQGYESMSSYQPPRHGTSSTMGTESLIVEGAANQVRNMGSQLQLGVSTIGAFANLNITEDNNLESRAIQARYLTGQETDTPDFDTAVGTGSNTGTISIATRASIYQNHMQRRYAVYGTEINQTNLDNRNDFHARLNLIDAESTNTIAKALAGNSLHNQTGGAELAYADGTAQTVRLNVTPESGHTGYQDATITPLATKADGTVTGTLPRSRDTTKGNAKRSHDTSTSNAKRTYDAALATVTAGVNTDNRGVPVQITEATGDASLWSVTPVGVTVRVDRPLDGDLIRIADRMNRFGYYCRRLITSPGLLQMPEWTYWRCDAATVRPGSLGAPRAAVEYVRGALMRGVTVWAKPEQIGDIEQ